MRCGRAASRGCLSETAEATKLICFLWKCYLQINASLDAVALALYVSVCMQKRGVCVCVSMAVLNRYVVL